jgi:hypothetical protein
MIGWGIGVPDSSTQKVDANQRYYKIPNLDANREYVISLRAYNKAGNGFPMYESIRTLQMGARVLDTRLTDEQSGGGGGGSLGEYDEDYSDGRLIITINNNNNNT